MKAIAKVSADSDRMVTDVMSQLLNSFWSNKPQVSWLMMVKLSTQGRGPRHQEPEEQGRATHPRNSEQSAAGGVRHIPSGLPSIHPGRSVRVVAPAFAVCESWRFPRLPTCCGRAFNAARDSAAIRKHAYAAPD